MTEISIQQYPDGSATFLFKQKLGWGLFPANKQQARKALKQLEEINCTTEYAAWLSDWSPCPLTEQDPQTIFELL